MKYIMRLKPINKFDRGDTNSKHQDIDLDIDKFKYNHHDSPYHSLF